MRQIETEVLVIGGGATGTGIIRDLAMRGFDAVLVEARDWASGTTGRYNGLVHSGSRYALKDVETARECVRENRILRHIMPHCIEDTGGYIVATPHDDPHFGDKVTDCCRQADVPIEEVPVAEALREEPFLNRRISRCLRTPEATADSFRAARDNVESARRYGAQAYSYHPVTRLLVEGGRIVGALCQDLIKDEAVRIDAGLVVNAAGAWTGKIAASAGINIPVLWGKGSMIALNYRFTDTVILRMRWPSDNDSVQPNHSASILGSTDVIVDDPDHYGVEAAEIRAILEDGDQLVPGIKDARLLRVWAGVRPLYKAAEVQGSSDRDLSRTHVILDHQQRDALPGMLTMVGGKWTTYRLMAEEMVDEVCRKLDNPRPCRTHLEPLPGAGKGGYHWQAAPLARVEQAENSDPLLCECELVTQSDLERAVLEEDAYTIDDIRRSTRLGMGSCQAGFCSYRAAGLLHRIRRPPVAESNLSLRDFLRERWKGVLPIISGQQLRQMRFNELVYRDLLNVEQLPGPTVSGLSCTTYDPSGPHASARNDDKGSEKAA